MTGILANTTGGTSKVKRHTVAILAVFVLALAFAQDKVVMKFTGQKDQAMTYRANVEISMEAAGQKVTIEINTTTKDKIIDVAENGNVTREETTETYEMTVNGEKAPTPDEALKTKYTTVVKPNGELVSTKVEGADEPEDQAELRKRFGQAQRIVFSTNPVGVGDKWSHTFVEDKTIGTLPGRADYEVLAFETIKGIECVKIKHSYTETATSTKLTAEGELYLEKASGDMVKAEYKVDGLPFGPDEMGITASGKITSERQSGSPVGATTVAGEPEKKKEKTIEEVTKDFTKTDGLFTMYHKKDAGKDTIYWEIKEEQLDRLLFMQATAATGIGGIMSAAGDPIMDMVFKFVRRDEQVLLVVPNISFKADDGTPIARALRRSIADAYLEAFKVEAKSEERKSVLINVSDLFRGDIARVTQKAGMSGGQATIDREKTAYSAIKMFEDNFYIQTAYSFNRSQGGGGGMAAILGMMGGSPALADPRNFTYTVNYNLMALPMDGYRPRMADPRVGYFTTEVTNWNEMKEDMTDRYILRWRLEKSDPSANLSKPKKPIVFWLDNAIPVEFRDAIRKGLLVWNKAFEKVGFQDAVVVEQMPDDADWDHADMSRNVIRWVTSPGSAYAVAWFRPNPLTGEILNAGITFDANMALSVKMEFESVVDPVAIFAEKSEHDASHLICTLGQEKLYNAALGLMSLEMIAGENATKITKSKFIEDFLMETAAHEMGHILGLRHNFIASSMHSTDDLANGELLKEKGVTASVMEYAPFNNVALRSPNSQYWTTTVGPYDIHAIEYGYKHVSAADAAGEKPALNIVAARYNQPGLAYQSDEIADRWDPMVTRFDLGRDPMAYWIMRMEDSGKLLQELPRRYPERGESYWQFTRRFNMVMGMHAQSASQLTRFIGGVNISGNHKGDPGEKPALRPVPVAAQKRALAMIRQNVLAKDAYSFTRAYYSMLALDPWAGGNPPNLMDSIGNVQLGVLNRLMNPGMLNRLINQEFQSPGAALTVKELFDEVYAAVWEELPAGATVTPLRRNLQRTHLQALIDMAIQPNHAAPADAKMLARSQLRRLNVQLKGATGKAQDAVSQVHFADLAELSTKALNAQIVIGQQTPAPRTPSLLELLGIGKQ